MKLLIFSVLPSPYQRDLLRALAERPGMELRVFYAEHAAPDSPWPMSEFERWEQVLPGRCFAAGNLRVKMNTDLPEPARAERVVVNLDITSLTTQWLMRRLPAGRWMFWGEQLRQQKVPWRRTVSNLLTAPIQRSAGIAAVGQRAAADYSQRFPGKRVISIPYHCDLTPFLRLPASPGSKREVTFLFCGQMIARKGFDILLEAFAAVAEQGARLLLIGRETEETECIAALPAVVRARVENAGFQSPDRLPAFFARADVFVLPSRYEGWGVVVNQALGAGLPLLCSEAVGASELVESEVNGWIFEKDSVAALRSAMENALTRREHLASMGSASRERAALWSPASGAEKWEAALEECT